MNNEIKNFYDGLKTPTFFVKKDNVIWCNKSAENLVKNTKLIEKIKKLEKAFLKEESEETFFVDEIKYNVKVRPFKDLFIVEFSKEASVLQNSLQKFYSKLKTPVFFCKNNNIIWYNAVAANFFSNIQFKNNILQFKDYKEEQVESFICDDYFYKVFVRPFESFFYVEVVEKRPIGFDIESNHNNETNKFLETELLDTISRAVVHDIGQALARISAIMEKNNNINGLELVDIIAKRMYSFMRATNLCYEYEVLLKEKDNMNAEIIDIFVEIDALCTTIQSLIGRSQVFFTWDVPKEKIFCDIDIHKLGFSLFHLICNSYKFSTPMSKIKLIAKMEETKYIKIDICDTGVGIPENIKDKVLIPFFSYDHFSGDIAGVGLGLSYVALFASKVNGSFNITSTVEGTKATLKIPIVSLTDVMGLSSHIVNYSEGKYDSMVSTMVGDLREHDIKV